MVAIDAAARFIMDWLLMTSLYAAVVAAVVLLCTASLRRWLTPGARCALWALVLVRLLMPGTPASRWSVYNLLTPPQPTPQAVGASAEKTSQSDQWVVTKGGIDFPYAPEHTLVPVESASWDWRHGVAMAWLLGVVVMLVRVVRPNLMLNLRLRKAQRVTDADVLHLLESCQREMGVRRRVEMLMTDAVDGAALTGVWRPRVLLPLGMLESLSREELRFVLLHEMAHLKRWDVPADWGMALLQAMHWFNPLVWVAFARLRAERELSRDCMVLAASGSQDRCEYGRTVLKLVEALRPRMRVGMVGIGEGNKSDLKRRISMIAEFGNVRGGAKWLTMVLVMVIAAATMTGRADVPADVRADVPADDGVARENAAREAAVRDATIKALVVENQKLVEERHERELKDRDAAKKNQQVKAALDRAIPEVRFEGVPLSDAIDFMRDVTGANILVDWRALSRAKVDKNAPVTVRVQGVSFEKALATILQSIDSDPALGFVVQDGVILITTQLELDKNVGIKVYDIRDLIVGAPDFRFQDGGVKAEPQDKDLHERLAQDVINVIKETIAPETWKGGTGSIRYLAGQLIVTATPQRQADVEKLINQLRETRGVQVMLEVKFIKADLNALDAKALGFDVLGADQKTGKLGMLDDAQVKKLLTQLQVDEKRRILSAPRLTLFNGQSGSLMVGSEMEIIVGWGAKNAAGERQPIKKGVMTDGHSLNVQATASADRKHVTMTLHPRAVKPGKVVSIPWEKAEPGEKLLVQKAELDVEEIATTVSVPDGATLVTTLTKVAGEREKNAPLTLLLVKPKLIIQKEIPDDARPPVRN